MIGTGIRIILESGHHNSGCRAIVEIDTIVGITHIAFIHIDFGIGKADIAARSLAYGAVHQLRLSGFIEVNIGGSLFNHTIAQGRGCIVVAAIVEIEAAPATRLTILCGEMDAVGGITHGINASTIRVVLIISNMDLLSGIHEDGAARGNGQSGGIAAIDGKVATGDPVAIVILVPSAVARNSTARHHNINAVIGEQQCAFVVGEATVGRVGIEAYIVA